MFQDDLLAALAAKVYDRKNWHTLREDERALVALLTEAGYLIEPSPPDGRAGEPSEKARDILLKNRTRYSYLATI